MSSNSFGRHFRIITFGESHGRAVGVVIDGVPPLIKVSLEGIQAQLDRRKPGQARSSSKRREADRVRLVSGLMEGMTTGAPICFLVTNEDAKSEDYQELKDVFRPGHGDLTWFMKYGIRDWRGGGRGSGRETVARVAAGAVARQVLSEVGVSIRGHALEIGGVRARQMEFDQVDRNPLRCADPHMVEQMQEAVDLALKDGDSVGGIVEVRVNGVPAGWGDPVFDKLDALLASGLMSVGAVKGVELGGGFSLSRMRGSEANDEITPDGFATNNAGGVLGGISSGAEIVVRAAVKPTPSIRKPQCTVDSSGNPTIVSIGGRHDPCIVPRLVPVAEAMVALVLADCYLAQRAITGSPNGPSRG
jgi:chorismate synthase